jgi:hypothetical protein
MNTRQEVGENLIRNAMQTPDGTVIESVHRHDYVTYEDANGKTYMVDGGLAYSRRSVHADQIDLNEYDDAPHERQREILTWGTYGIDGDQPLQYKTIAEMETGHLESVIGLGGVYPSLRTCMTEELRLRKQQR